MKKIVVLTSNELRHQFFRIYLSTSSDLQILKSYCESGLTLNEKLHQGSSIEERNSHLIQRTQTEVDFFQAFVEKTPDQSNPTILKKGEINEDQIVTEIIQSNPDLIVSYGCSIIKSDLLYHFKNRFINIHLGLSPYYRGSGTNFWPFVNGEPGMIGVTFMHIDEGIDTGCIIHQIRADIYLWDNIHSIGNRLIIKTAKVCQDILTNFEKLSPIPITFFPLIPEKNYKIKDFNEQAVIKAYHNLREGVIEKYLTEKESFDNQFPIFENPGINLK